MSKENVESIKGIYAAFSTGDVAGVVGRMSSSIVWNEAQNVPYADGNLYVGPEAAANGVFARCIGEWNRFTVAIDEILDAGDAVISFGRHLGTFKATGKAMRTQLVHAWRVVDGKAVRSQQYADTLQLARVTGHA